MAYYVSSPQLPMVYTFEDCTKTEVQDYVEDLMLGTSRRADDPAKDEELESEGFVIKSEAGAPRIARRGPWVETLDAEDPDPSYVIDWGRVACVAITDADPDPGAEHWEVVIDDNRKESIPEGGEIYFSKRSGPSREGASDSGD